MPTKTKEPKTTETKETKVKEDKPVKITHPVKPTEVKAGDVMMVYHFVKVSRNQYGNVLSVTDLDDNNDIQVQGSTLIARAASADQFQEVVETSQTEVIKKLVTSYNRPFTVNFDKDPDKKGVVENRTLRGRLLGVDDLRGRSFVEDLDLPAGKRDRQVNHRALYWLIVDGVKYVAK